MSMPKLLGALFPMTSPPEQEKQADLMPLSSGPDESGWTRVRSVADTGAMMSVIQPGSVSGYVVRPSAMSKAGECFASASNTEIPNEGELVLPTMSSEGVVTRQVWQVAEVTKNLLSIMEETDQDQ